MKELIDDLLKRFQKGDQSAFRIIVKRFQGKALDLAESIIGDRHQAEDAVQTAFMLAFSRLNQLREIEAFPGWLRQIVRTEALKIIRKSKRQGKDFEKQNNQISPPELDYHPVQ